MSKKGRRWKVFVKVKVNVNVNVNVNVKVNVKVKVKRTGYERKWGNRQRKEYVPFGV